MAPAKRVKKRTPTWRADGPTRRAEPICATVDFTIARRAASNVALRITTSFWLEQLKSSALGAFAIGLHKLDIDVEVDNLRLAHAFEDAVDIDRVNLTSRETKLAHERIKSHELNLQPHLKAGALEGSAGSAKRAGQNTRSEEVLLRDNVKGVQINPVRKDEQLARIGFKSIGGLLEGVSTNEIIASAANKNSITVKATSHTTSANFQLVRVAPGKTRIPVNRSIVLPILVGRRLARSNALLVPVSCEASFVVEGARKRG